MIRLSSLRMALPSEFTAGTLVLSYGYRHARGRKPSVGIRVGSTNKVFAVSDWYEGRLRAGKVFEPDAVVCGVSATEYDVQAVYDLTAASVEWVSDYDGAGQIGFSNKGVRILSSIGEMQNRRAIVIDPATWEVEADFDAEWTLPGGAVRIVDRRLNAVAETFCWPKGQDAPA